MLDEELQAAYRERGVPSEWREMTPETMAPAFRLWFRALPSPGSEVEGWEEAELLIHQPLVALRQAGILPESDEEPHISTMVVNHEKTLQRFIMYAFVVASTNPSTVGITLIKEAG